MSTLYCAICGERFEPEHDHVRVEPEYVGKNVGTDDRDFVFHSGCWERLSQGWMEPA